MTTVSIRPGTITSTGDPVLIVESPYHPDFAPRAKALGGRWQPTQRHWHFDPRDADRVRSLCRDIYGTDGSPDQTADTITIRATATTTLYVDRAGVYLAGRCVAHATGRDSGARLGGGVIHVAGRKPGSGGSVKNWTTTIPEGCALEIRDLPRPAVDAELADPLWAIEILADVPTQAEMAQLMGQGIAASDLERAWEAVRALPEQDQAVIRNRLLQEL